MSYCISVTKVSSYSSCQSLDNVWLFFSCLKSKHFFLFNYVPIQITYPLSNLLAVLCYAWNFNNKSISGVWRNCDKYYYTDVMENGESCEWLACMLCGVSGNVYHDIQIVDIYRQGYCIFLLWLQIILKFVKNATPCATSYSGWRYQHFHSHHTTYKLIIHTILHFPLKG
jgi:hypothetical protein